MKPPPRALLLLLAGLAHVYLTPAASAQGTVLTEAQRIAPETPVQGADFGRHAHVLSGLAVFGAIGDTLSTLLGNERAPGAVYVYDRDPATGDWVQAQRIPAPSPYDNFDFGRSIAIATDAAGAPLVLAVGDPEEDVPVRGGPERVGAVYFYERGAGGAWERTGRFATDAEPHLVGRDLRADAAGGVRFIATAFGDSVAHIVERSAGEEWASTARLVPPRPTPTGRPLNRYADRAVLSGAVAVVSEDGAYYDTEGERRASALHVFEQVDAGAWAYAARLQPPPEAGHPLVGYRDTRFGRSLALAPHGRYAPGDPTGPPLLITSASRRTPYGGVFVYERAASGSWERTAELVPSDVAPGDQFGTKVAAMAQRGGGVLVAASSRGADVGEVNTGAAYAFFQAAPGAPWVEVAKLIKSGPPDRHLNFGEDGIAVSPEGEVVVSSNREAVEVGEETLQAAGASYRYDLRGLLPVSSEPAPPEPSAFALTVWPNPSGGAASPPRVRLSGVVGEVRVSVVDALGREVAVLHEGPVAEGAAWSLPALAPGVYAVRAVGRWGAASGRITIVE